jgi:hypothetical protein
MIGAVGRFEVAHHHAEGLDAQLEVPTRDFGIAEHQVAAGALADEARAMFQRHHAADVSTGDDLDAQHFGGGATR